ncbi:MULTISPECIES: tetratricopeptide repeat protein [unclassified Beijerinckia]|uniref:SEL1-like repeat protein n=1 Tax=unclassified Beijerinckia TaxID=2638183 RepID=UPI00089B2292|nr:MULTISPECIES: tetratricopeptide repeat protein [unclassified Beijerinckia]MDH7797358.1 localization factor PodJL [Beijerinckia sp. GAS462]SEC82439.1 localization factor PodJL [Beijerinckia sp. 28-YEA-48]
MNKAVPWSIKGVDFNAREAAKEAARRSGMTLGEWLNSVIADQAEELGVDPDEVDDNQKVEAVSRRLARMAPDSGYRQERLERPERPVRQERQQRRSDRQEPLRQERLTQPRQARFAREDDEQEARWAERSTPRRRRLVEDDDMQRDEQPQEPRYARMAYEEAPRWETPRQEAPRQESLRQELLRQEVLRQEAARQEAARQEAARQEAARHQESLRQEAFRQEALRQEELRQEELRQEEIRQERIRQEQIQQEQLHQEQLRQDQLRQEQLRQEQLQREPRSDGLYVVTSRDLGSPREAEALLDDAIRGFERGTRRYQAQTNATLDKFSRRLAELEAHLNERAERAAAARDEFRAERRAAPQASPLAARVEERAQENSDRNGYFAEIDKKLSQLVERMEGGAKPAAPDPDMQRIEEKLNALLNRQAMPAEAPVAAGPRHARPPARLQLSDALSQIARRQRNLDQQPEAPEPASASAPIAPMRFTEPRLDAAAQEREASALRGDIAALSTSLEALRRDMKERESAQAEAAAEAAADAAAAAITAAAATAPVAASAVEQLRQQIAEMTTVVATLPQRESFVALEAATRDLVGRVETSRQEGVRENILQPIEALVEHIQRILTEFSPRATIDAIKREIGIIAENVGSVGNKGVDTVALTRLNEQTREIRELLQTAAARPMPIENIERQIADLARRVDLIAQRGSTKLGSDAVTESVQAIRQTIENQLPTSLLHTLEQRIEGLGRKIDEAVNQEPAPIETRALEDMMRDIAARLDRPQVPVVGDFSQLEESVRELAQRVDTAGRPGAPSAAFNALEEQIARLASRLDQSDSSLGRLPDLQRSLGEIVGLIEQSRSQAIEAAEQAARTAAREAMSQIGALTSAPDPLRGQIVNEIAGLRDGQEAMDRRTRSTLTAVHETLEKVVDRLAMIESGYPPAPAAPAPVQPARTPERPAPEPAPRVTPVAPDAELLASGPAPSFARSGVPQLQTGEPTAEGLGRQVSADHIMRASGARPGAPMRPAPEPIVPEDDILLEPGSGSSPRKGGSAQRRATASSTMAELDPQPEPGSAQQSFIAAARRARETAVDTPSRPRGSGDDALAEARARAKAAAAALAVDTDTAEDEGLGAFGRARAFISQRKRPILLSLAGIILALGALTVVRSMNNEATPPSRPQVGALQPPREPSKSQMQAPAVDKAPRQITGINAPITANELAALGNKFVQDKPAQDKLAQGKFVQDRSVQDRSVQDRPVQDKPVQEPAAPALAPEAKPQVSALQQVLGNTDAAPVGSISTPVPAKGQDLRAAATAGDAAAQYELATRLFEGRTIARDLPQAAQWFEKAALQDLAPAQYRLGSLYEKGVGVARDTARAKTLYQRAADRGNIRAMHNLAVLYAEGSDGKPDYAAAAQWFRKASEHGVRDSQYNLAILYARGLGIGQDMTQSWVWFSLAAAQGDEDSGKKRNDVAARLNAQQLAAAKAIVENFKPKVNDAVANEVTTPPGGWELAAPVVAKPETSAAKPEKRLPTAAPARPRVSAL